MASVHFFVALHDQFAHFFLWQAVVLKAEFFRHNSIEDHASRSCLNDAAICRAQLDEFMDAQAPRNDA